MNREGNLRIALSLIESADKLRALLAGASQNRQLPRGVDDAEAAESGYWDLVYLLYPELAEAAGLGLLRALVPAWPRVERTLAVRGPVPPPNKTVHALVKQIASWDPAACMADAHSAGCAYGPNEIAISDMNPLHTLHC